MQHHDSNYSDPYAQAPAYPAQQQSYPPQQSEYPDYSQHNANVYPPNAPYTEENRKSYHSLGNNAGFHPNESTEKMVEPDQGFIGGTERERPGRQRQMGDVPVSWAGMGPPPRSTGILRMWRKEERGSQWIRGNGVSTTLRWFVCVVTFAVLIILTLALSIALYIRPPNVIFHGVNLGASPVSVANGSLQINFGVDLSVSNPNWFSVDFKQVTATAKYPLSGKQYPFGGGTLYNLDFKGYTDSTFNFPLTLNYSIANDDNRQILTDLSNKCGVTGGTAQDITIDYTLNLALKIIGISLKPSASGSVSFQCPISASDLEGLGESILGNS